MSTQDSLWSFTDKQKNMDTNRNVVVASVVGLILIVLAVTTSHASDQSDGLLHVSFLDVGQGDSILIQAPNGNQVLVDGGKPGSVLSELGRVLPFYDRTIDVIVATHPHADHIGGLIDVLDRFEVGMVVEAYETYDSSEFRNWQKAVINEGALRVEALAGKQISLGNETTLTVLYPFNSAAETRTTKPHEDIVVAMLQYKNVRVLLTGDMETKVEQALITKGLDIDADVLKVGHHGSNTSTSTSFVSVVSPQTAVIQVGARNVYRHPHPTVIQRLENAAIKLYRTDTNGTVTLTSDGDTFSIESTQ